MILEWLAERMSQPPWQLPSRYRHGSRRRKRPNAKNFKIAADYLEGVPLKQIGHPPTIYRTVKLFGLPLRRPAQVKALKVRAKLAERR